MSEGVYRVQARRPQQYQPRRWIPTAPAVAAAASFVVRRPLPASNLRRDHQRRAHRPQPHRLFAGPRPSGSSLVLARRQATLRRPTPARRDQVRQQHLRRWVPTLPSVAVTASLLARRPSPPRRERQRRRDHVLVLRRPWAGTRRVSSLPSVRHAVPIRRPSAPARARRLALRRPRWIPTLAPVVSRSLLVRWPRPKSRRQLRRAVRLRLRSWTGTVGAPIAPGTSLREYVQGRRPDPTDEGRRQALGISARRPRLTAQAQRTPTAVSGRRPDTTQESRRKAR
jgi:hypothetical protein